MTVTQASSVPMSLPASGGQNSSFAAALRKLAKNAMSPGSQSPVSVLQPPNNSTMSPVKANGMSSKRPRTSGRIAIHLAVFCHIHICICFIKLAETL